METCFQEKTNVAKIREASLRLHTCKYEWKTVKSLREPMTQEDNRPRTSGSQEQTRSTVTMKCDAQRM